MGGDAVHLFAPTGGMGYNTAVDDAANVGWKLAAAVRGQGGRNLIANYEAERKPVGLRFNLPTRSGSTPDAPGVYTPSAKPGGRAPHTWLDGGDSP